MKPLDVIMKHLTKKFAYIHCMHVSMKACSAFYALGVFHKWEMKYYPDHFKIRDVVEVATWRAVTTVGYLRCSSSLLQHRLNKTQIIGDV